MKKNIGLIELIIILCLIVVISKLLIINKERTAEKIVAPMPTIKKVVTPAQTIKLFPPYITNCPRCGSAIELQTWYRNNIHKYQFYCRKCIWMSSEYEMDSAIPINIEPGKNHPPVRNFNPGNNVH